VRRRSASGGWGHWVARARSLSEFQTSFPDERSCAAFLFERRWPQGFVCPACGGGRAALSLRADEALGARHLSWTTPQAHRHLSQRVRLPIQSALLPARLVRNHTRARLAPSPTSYWDIVGRDNPRKGVPTVRRQLRRRSDRHAGRPIKTSRNSRTQPRFGFDRQP
jgi:hypothetical protein